MSIIGHEDILSYLRQGAQQKRLSPSLLFVGPEGVGKRTVALEAAQILHCDTVSDFLFVDKEFQAGLLKEKIESQLAVKIESVRQIDRFLRIRPVEGSYRVCIVDGADKLTEDAANALLKILEEPPPRTQIILLAVFAKNILPTILSRCAVLRFRPLKAKDIALWLEKNRGVSQKEAEAAAERADGSLSRGIRLLTESDLLTLDDVTVDQFFASLAEPSWRKEGRVRAMDVVRRLTDEAQARLERGDLAQADSLKILFQARRQLDRHTPPRLVLENLFLKLRPVFK
jgi:DNA polymerase-3 subunit delta'